MDLKESLPLNVKMFANCGYILRYSGLLSKKGFGTLTVPTAMEMRKRWER